LFTIVTPVFAFLSCSLRTSIHQQDIITTLTDLKMVKYWKGQHVICISPKTVMEYVTTCGLSEPKILVDGSAIRWDPPRRPSKKNA
jgi:histone acetyltransferase MYST1